jgi:hypothetical protein
LTSCWEYTSMAMQTTSLFATPESTVLLSSKRPKPIRTSLLLTTWPADWRNWLILSWRYSKTRERSISKTKHRASKTKRVGLIMRKKCCSASHASTECPLVQTTRATGLNWGTKWRHRWRTSTRHPVRYKKWCLDWGGTARR